MTESHYTTLMRICEESGVRVHRYAETFGGSITIEWSDMNGGHIGWTTLRVTTPDKMTTALKRQLKKWHTRQEGK